MIIRNNRQVKHIYHEGKLVKERYRNGKLVHKEEQGGGEDNYTLRFTPEGSTTVTFSGWVSRMNIEYSKDNTHWEQLRASTTNVSVGNGEVLYVRGDNPNGLSTSFSEKLNITTSSKTIISGDIMSLLFPIESWNTKVIPCNNCFTDLFYYARYIDIDENFKMSATTLASYCYGSMFNYCSSLTTAPSILPATTLASSCYNSMFYGCSKLSTAPELPATIMKSYSYSSMFEGCSSLRTAPQLPATNLNLNCYNNMFKGCSSLTTAPSILPATTLSSGCYESMFDGCKSLTTAPQLSAITLASDCFRNMFNGCSSITTAPELHAASSVSGSYYYMFRGCSKLNYIKVSDTYWSGLNSTDWVSGVSPTGTFVKKSGADIPTGTSGIPEGWTVEEF